MNSPLVVEQAKHLVALADFNACPDDEARIQFLYQRIYQRPPAPEEIKLGVEFIATAPASEKVSVSEADDSVRTVSNDDRPTRPRQLARQQGRQGPNGPRRRPPLKAWEEYAHALLQANEASFLN